MIWAYASKSHYASHIEPVWEQLPRGLRGRFIGPSGPDTTTPALDWKEMHRTARLVLAASYTDVQRLGPRRIVLVEHGAGQSYGGDPRSARNGSYSGGDGHDHVELFLSPNQAAADRWLARYPSTRAVVVGCPKLDRLLWQKRRPWPDQPRTAITWHWDCPRPPEARSALNHYRGALRTTRAEIGACVGHCHPRSRPATARAFALAGIPFTNDWAKVLGFADLLVADNTSVMYEWAALDRPVVVLNAPWYRRDVEHGLRFWQHIPGPQVDEPEQLAPTIKRALAEPDWFAEERRAAALAAFTWLDGGSSARSIAAILETYGTT